MKTKKIFATIATILFASTISAANITSTIWNGERASECNWWANTGDNTNEPVTYVETPVFESDIENSSSHCLKMLRELQDGYEWHGIGFDLSSLNISLGSGNEYAVLINKDKAENIKLEFVFSDDTHFISDLIWIEGDSKWAKTIFKLWDTEGYDDVKDKIIKTIYVQPHTGGNDASIATIYIDDFICGFDLGSPTEYIQTNDDKKLIVYSQESALIIENATSNIQVFDAQGRLIAEAPANQQIRIESGVGMFIVKSGSESHKIFVK